MLRSEGVERILLLCLSFVMLSFFVWKEVRIFVAETDCLKELKQHLISGVVTGLIKRTEYKREDIMDREQQDIAYFISFCIEQYKNAKSMSGEEAMQLFSQYGVLEYLYDFFDVLHTQGHQWILADIDEFIQARRKEEEK